MFAITLLWHFSSSKYVSLLALVWATSSMRSWEHNHCEGSWIAAAGMSASSICGRSQSHARFLSCSCMSANCICVFAKCICVTIACMLSSSCLHNVVTHLHNSDVQLHIGIIMSAVFTLLHQRHFFLLHGIADKIFVKDWSKDLQSILAWFNSPQHILQSWQVHHPSLLVLAIIYPPPHNPLQST